MSKPSNWVVWASLGIANMGGEAVAHAGIIPHPETTSELWHFLVHVGGGFPVVFLLFLLARGISRWHEQRSVTRNRRD